MPAPRSHPPRWRERLASALALASLLTTLAWGLGQGYTDRFHWSQYLYWIPSIAALLLAGALLLLSILLLPRPRTRGALLLRLASSAGVLVGAASIASSSLAPSRTAPRPAAPALSLVYWNMGARITPAWCDAPIARSPDLLLVRPGEGATFPEIVRRLSPDPAHPADFLYQQGFAVVSRFDILAYRIVDLSIPAGLGFDPRRSDLTQKYPDPGRVLQLLLRVPARAGDGTPADLIVWVVDLPSDLSLPRRDMLARARQTLDAAGGPVFSRADRDSRWLPAGPDAEFPRLLSDPDVVVGDFNTPGPSHALREFARGLRFADPRHPATYPRAYPLWALDHALLKPGLVPLEHAVFDPGVGAHRALWLRLAREP